MSILIIHRVNETREHNGVIICGNTSYVGEMAKQASELYGSNMFNLVQELCHIPEKNSNTADNYKIDLNDEIMGSAIIVYKGQYPIPQKPKPEEKKKPESKVVAEKKQAEPEKIKESAAGPLSQQLVEENKDETSELVTIAKMDIQSSSLIILTMTVIAMGLAYSTNYAFMLNFLSFVLALIIGYIVVWGVNPLLHASLMSETNAISGIIVIGTMLQLYGFDGSLFALPSFFGTIALFFASINVFGGFILTDKMLSMLASS